MCALRWDLHGSSDMLLLHLGVPGVRHLAQHPAALPGGRCGGRQLQPTPYLGGFGTNPPPGALNER